jgi:hypothetical protein
LGPHRVQFSASGFELVLGSCHILGVVPPRNFLFVGQHIPKPEIIVISTMGPIKCFRHILVLFVFASLAGGRFQISNLPSEKAGIAGSLDKVWQDDRQSQSRKSKYKIPNLTI